MLKVVDRLTFCFLFQMLPSLSFCFLTIKLSIYKYIIQIYAISLCLHKCTVQIILNKSQVIVALMTFIVIYIIITMFLIITNRCHRTGSDSCDVKTEIVPVLNVPENYKTQRAISMKYQKHEIPKQNVGAGVMF